MKKRFENIAKGAALMTDTSVNVKEIKNTFAKNNVSSIIISAIQKLVSAFEDAPRALIIVADEVKALEMKEQFKLLSRETDLRAELAFDGGKIDAQTEAIYFGTDIVIGTAKRVLEIYFRKNFNLNNDITFYTYNKSDPSQILEQITVNTADLNNFNLVELKLKSTTPVQMISNYQHLHIEDSNDNAYYKF